MKKYRLWIWLMIQRILWAQNLVIEGCKEGYTIDRFGIYQIGGSCIKSNNVSIIGIDNNNNNNDGSGDEEINGKTVEICCDRSKSDCSNSELYISNIETLKICCGYEKSCNRMKLELHSIKNIEIKCTGTNSCLNNYYNISSVSILNVDCINSAFPCENSQYLFQHITNTTFICQGDGGCSTNEWMIEDINKFHLQATQTTTTYNAFSCNSLLVGKNVKEFLIECIGEDVCRRNNIDASAANHNITIKCMNENSCTFISSDIKSPPYLKCPDDPNAFCVVESNDKSNFDYMNIYVLYGISTLKLHPHNSKDDSSFQYLMLFTGYQYKEQYLCNWDFNTDQLSCTFCQDCQLADYGSSTTTESDSNGSGDESDGSGVSPMLILLAVFIITPVACVILIMLVCYCGRNKNKKRNNKKKQIINNIRGGGGRERMLAEGEHSRSHSKSNSNEEENLIEMNEGERRILTEEENEEGKGQEILPPGEQPPLLLPQPQQQQDPQADNIRDDNQQPAIIAFDLNNVGVIV